MQLHLNTYMSWVYDRYKYLILSYISAGIDLEVRIILTPIDVRFWRLKMVYLNTYIMSLGPLLIFRSFSVGIDLDVRINMTSIDVRFWRVKTVPTLSGLTKISEVNLSALTSLSTTIAAYNQFYITLLKTTSVVFNSFY